VLAPALTAWAAQDPALEQRRRLRVALTFGLEGHPWLPELTLQRYELLYEAGLVPEAHGGAPTPGTGLPMDRDHRRVVATGVSRLRAKIQYRPVVFEMLPESF